MKKIIFYAFFAMFIFCVSCADREKKIIDDKLEVINDSCYVDAKVVNVLLTIGNSRFASSSVAYLLLDNNDVIIYARPNTATPFTKDEARDIMRFQHGDTVVIRVPR